MKYALTLIFIFSLFNSCSNHKKGNAKQSISSNNKTIYENKEWDKMLSDYENYVDEYLKFFIKAKEGDVSALQEYPTLLEKTEKLQNSLAKAQENKTLTEAQIRKMMRIQNKILEATIK
jgi:hypothetical protein